MKKGFMSTTMVYSFFLLFLLMLLFIVENLVNNRTLLNNIKTEIKEDIADSTLKKYLINHSNELGLVQLNDKLENSSLDYSYRYVGDNPNNYICFGSNEEVCPEDNLYRIIGVIDGKIKIIKKNSIGPITFDTTDTNHYINTYMYSYLNDTFYYTFNEIWQNKISINDYYVSGLKYNLDSIKEIYDSEINKDGTIVNCKIGLMYISDYNYASSVDNWNNYNMISTNNWLNNGENNWLITRNYDTNNSNYYIDNTGLLKNETVEKAFYIRPVFYLNSTISWNGGNGLENNPYRIGG